MHTPMKYLVPKLLQLVLVPSIYPLKQKFAFTNIVSYLTSSIGGQILLSSTI